MRRLQSELLAVVDKPDPVLLLGETGVGKEVAARQLHDASVRKDLPFVIVNCATIPNERAESVIFGHERGAIPGSRPPRSALSSMPAPGTLVPGRDSGAVARCCRGSLLRLLEDGRFSRLGGTQEMISEARIVSSSNADLPASIKEGRFRADLYYRLNVTELRIPPLACAAGGHRLAR